ncbi:hypothetical protein Acsp04_23320 [Actinomadura sp. NBRC 104425]|uniref:hypothetical protein n=1 Tax=Actinomadura sp. NBRC 104425 TaxID=3032204 RepID=UPI0024A3C576|nr:hypothetical protein [Actinomadura sp. NBRC 104425]GLZ12097.1 hypothetical protein Acsp04_23320 [Actinomadura sp. NBRC 104425]
MKGTVYKRCGCKDPSTGKQIDLTCPKLSNSRYGTWTLDVRINTTERKGRRLKRGGYTTKKQAETALDHIHDLIKLAGADDRLRQRIGDMIFAKSARRGPLPTIEEVRRKLGASADLTAPEVTVREELESWIETKRHKKLNTWTSYRRIMDQYLIPLLGEIPRDQLMPEHILGMIDTIEEWNAEIQAAEQEGRKPYLPDDKRTMPRKVGIASQHRILAVLRNCYNQAIKRPGTRHWNPCLAVELPPEVRDPARVWSPEQVARSWSTRRTTACRCCTASSCCAAPDAARRAASAARTWTWT